MPIAAPPRYELLFSPTGTVRVGGDIGAEISNSFTVHGHRIAGAFQSGLPNEICDLVDIALAVYVSDRLCRRGANRDARYLFDWARRLRIVIPVRNPELWSGSSVYTKLVKALAFLTEDVWEFDFQQRKDVTSSYQQEFFPEEIESPKRVALFSGGLDSLGGLCTEICQQKAKTYILFAGSTNFHQKNRQTHLAAEVAKNTNVRLVPCIVPYGLRGRKARAGNRDEPSQRTRGFVHAALGVATAVMAGCNELAIYENGIGAINLPYSGSQLGTHLTRAAHPIALEMLSRLFSVVLDRKFDIDLPFLTNTKAEVLRGISDLGLESLISETNSCDRFLRENVHQCGICTSCVLRRQSLFAAGLREYDKDEYAFNLYSSDIAVAEKKIFGFRMMVDQVSRVRSCVTSDTPWESLRGEFPQLLEVALQLEQIGYGGRGAETVTELYRRYCEEWDVFPGRPPVQHLYSLRQHGGDL